MDPFLIPASRLPLWKSRDLGKDSPKLTNLSREKLPPAAEIIATFLSLEPTNTLPPAQATVVILKADTLIYFTTWQVSDQT